MCKMVQNLELTSKKAFEVVISKKSEFSIQIMYSCSVHVHVDYSTHSIYIR